MKSISMTGYDLWLFVVKISFGVQTTLQLHPNRIIMLLQHKKAF